MKTTLTPRTRGSVLLVTLVISGILGFTLASYLTLISAQNRSVTRSQTWNASIPIAEAGIEEAIAHLNKNCIGNFIISTSPVEWNADGWANITDGIQKSNRLGDNYYIVSILTNAPYNTNSPAIFAEGYVPAMVSERSSDVMFATAGATVNQNVQPLKYVGRKVKVTTGSEGVMAKGLVAKDSIDLKGNNVATDSFDSEMPGRNVNGQYHPSVRRANGDVAVNGGITSSGTLGIGNANISGHVAVGPNGSISIGPNGTVGDIEWTTSNSGIQPGYARYDMNVDFPNVEIPYTSGSYPTGGMVTNTNVTAITVTNTTTTYPTGPGTVFTNTTPTTTVGYPTAGTYIGSVITNTFYTNATGYPSAGSYVGLVVTNTLTTTTTNLPGAGTYVGYVITNAPFFTTTTYPSSPFGPVTTNKTWMDREKDYPAAGTYVGSVTTAYTPTRYSYYRLDGYTYRQITGYTYQRITGYSYYQIKDYTVARIISYSLVTGTYTTNYSEKYYDFILEDGINYKMANLTGDVYVRGEATIYVTDTLDMEEMRISKGSRVKIYMGGTTVGGNHFVNENGTADSLWYFGLPTNTEINFHGNGGFCGVIYAPQAALSLGGGGNDRIDFIGASLTKTVKLNGHFNFHYDEALQRKGPRRGYIIKSWSEIGLNETN